MNRLLLMLLVLFSLVFIQGCSSYSLTVDDAVARDYLDSEAVSAADLSEGGHSGNLLTADRSSHWKSVRNDHIRRFPECAACGKGIDDGLYVHHIQPFHMKPELELDSSNLITFCYEHHFGIGHFGNWKTFNPNCVKDAANIRESLGLPKVSRLTK